MEASLIKTHKPYYNTDLKDDKSWNNVVITKEDYPRVLVVRSKELVAGKNFGRGSAGDDRGPVDFPQKIVYPDKVALPPLAYTFGPFPHGMQLQQALKLLRKIFPYRTKCEPCEEQLAKVRPLKTSQGLTFAKCKRCFDAQIGLCPGVCSGEMGRAEYRRIIRHIVLMFKGKKSLLVKSLEREMKNAAKEERFEEATRLRQQLFALTHIQDVSLIKDEYRAHGTAAQASRIEAYDIAHLAGQAHVGVMTVVEGGLPNKMEYRKFTIKQAKGGDDPGSLREVLSRRLAHNEWPMPKLIVVDGHTAQINAAVAVLKQYGIQIPVVGVVKDEKHRPRSIAGLSTVLKVNDRNGDLSRALSRDILLANAEAHRFAISFHRKKSRKNFTA